MKKRGKKAISPVIATILLILLSISAVLIIAGVMIPFIRDITKESKACFEVMDYLTIDTESGYTCYYDVGTNNIVNTTIKRGIKEINIEGFTIIVSGGGTSETFEIKDQGTHEKVKMLNGSVTLIIPQKGGRRTYSINTSLSKIEYAEVAPIVGGGKMCEPTDKAELGVCVAL